MIAGSGKTSAAINMMNDHPEKKFMFITPYLAEGERIMLACPKLNFVAPKEGVCFRKIDDFADLIRQGRNIVSTHALLVTMTTEISEMVYQQGYTLVLDEVCSLIEKVSISKKDLQWIFDNDVASVNDDGKVEWCDDHYGGGAYADIKNRADHGNLYYYKKMLMFNVIPPVIFQCFSDVLVLTYLFDFQIQKFYFDMYGIDYSKLYVEYDEMKYQFSPKRTYMPAYLVGINDRIHILDNKKMNNIGEADTALSAGWYKRCKYGNAKYDEPMWRKVIVDADGKNPLAQLSKNIYNFYRRYTYCHAHTNTKMWTTFKEYRDDIAGHGYKNCFVSCNARATNEYRDRIHLAYCVNVYMNPVIKSFFSDNNCTVYEEGYALSEMVQWIWRSAIRTGRDVSLYVPSKRMRVLFRQLLEDLDSAGRRFYGM